MEPGGIAPPLVETAKRYKKPIMITENGVADNADKHRQWWPEETLAAVLTARAHGAEVIGYLHWSLLDNFEWKYGWWPKFGLVSVDRDAGMRRSIRPSGEWLRKYIFATRTKGCK